MSLHSIARKLFASLFFCGSLSLAVTISHAFVTGLQKVPQKQTPRKIVSDDFTRNRTSKADRSDKASSNEKQTKSQPSRIYHVVASTKTDSQPKIDAPARPDKQLTQSQHLSIAQLGVTLWRLRQMTLADKGATVLVKENGNESPWVAERVEADTVFQPGDFVRLSIESPHPGYLYVVNREVFGNKISDPNLIYPWAGIGRGENWVQAGKVVDIPSPEDSPSYFKARPTRTDQTGELVTIIVTKSPLNLEISKEPIKISNAQFSRWLQLWKSDSERFEMEGGAGELWTEKEKQAGSRTRTRELTRTDPAPQTIYHVTTKNSTGFYVNVRLAYAR